MPRLDVFWPLKIVSPVLLIIAVLACTPQQSTRKRAEVDVAASAYAALKAGNYRSAAEQFTVHARNAEAGQANRYWLNAASAWLWAHQQTKLKQALTNVPTAGLQGDLGLWRKILRAGVAVYSSNPIAALRELQPLAGGSITASLRRDLHYLRALLYGQTRERLNEARERMALAELLTTDSERKTNTDALWAALNEVTPRDLSRRRVNATPTFSGWLDLAALVQTGIHRPPNFDSALERWRARYPEHPAGQRIYREIRELSKSIAVRPRRIALLLPFTGKFAEAAAAVREGFLAAWYADTGNLSRPAIKLYDANVANIDSVYRQASEEGADLIVGPLERDAVDVVAARRPLPVVTLALNRAGAGPTAKLGAGQLRLYEFSLAPEDEARQVAERAWLHGYKRALCISPEGAWGDRLFLAFAEHWRALGGELLESQVFPRPNQDFATPVKRALNIDGSELRARELRKVLGQAVEAQARRRTDVDFVFLAAVPSEARQLRPQLDFYNGVDLPVFATSHVFGGISNRAADQDMNGITFGDMPWIIQPEHPEFAPFRQITDQWPEQAEKYSRLHALGVDAYRLIPELVKLRVQRYARFRGATGELRIVQHGRVQRQLTWAQFVDGRPRLLGDPTTE